MLITFYDSYTILQKVYNGTFLKQSLSDTTIRESSRSHVNKICYGVLDKNLYLDYVLSKFTSKSPKLSVKIILKIGLYSIIFLKTASYAVVDTCVELAKKLGKGGTAGFINGVLRNYLRNGVALPTDKLDYLSVLYSTPKFLVESLVADYGENLAEQILSSDLNNTYIRFNSGIDGEKYLTEKNINYQKTPFSDCFLVNGHKLDSDFYSGIYTFQSIGSVAICNMIEKGENLLDCCSAPGGKAVYLADKFNNVTACDVHEHRVQLINSYKSRMNKKNIQTYLLDSTEYKEEFNSYFDCVLCDAPCSGSGVIKDNPDIKLNRKKEDILSLTNLQKQILENVSKYVKVGGVLCYSTCSILQDENERQISNFLKNNSNFEVVKSKSLLKGLNLDYGIQFLPNLSSGAGFYFVKLKRTK